MGGGKFSPSWGCWKLPGWPELASPPSGPFAHYVTSTLVVGTCNLPTPHTIPVRSLTWTKAQ